MNCASIWAGRTMEEPFKRNTCSSTILLLLAGTLCQVVSQHCDLNFNLTVSSPDNTAEFVGLTASERVDVGGNSTGSILTCSCPAIAGLPAWWQNPPGSAFSNGSLHQGGAGILADGLPGTAVQLTISTTFTCADAGNYTCVIGNNTRQVLVLPVGLECSPTNITITPSPKGPLKVGEAVGLQCSAVDPTGSGLSYQWFKDNVLITEETSSALVLNTVGLNEVGQYACHVSNRVGMTRETYNLAVNIPVTEPPLLPDNLILRVLTAQCFNKAVRLQCQHPLPSGTLLATRPSWTEDGSVISIDGDMYRSVTLVSDTQFVLELVPERRRFEPSGSHNYTCFFPLVGGENLESNPIEVRPKDRPQQPGTPSSRPGIWEARIHWNRSDDQCFESQASCGLEYNISWTVSSGGSLYSATVPYPENEYIITGLRPSTEYTVNVRAQCQVDTALASPGSEALFTTQDSRDASLVLTTDNDTTCFDMPVHLQCNHPDPTSNVEGNPVFNSNRVNWKKDGAVIAMDGSTYQIIQQSALSTTLAVTYRREDYRDTSSKFTCFIPLSNGTLLESNEVKVHLNVSYAQQYNFIATGKYLDWLPIVACSPLVTPATNYNVTVAMQSDAGMEKFTFVTNRTSIEMNGSIPTSEKISVSLQILEAPVYFHLNSSQKYACLGEAYKMTCTSTGAFDMCGLSYPSWYKDGELVRCHNCTFTRGSKTDVLYAPIEDENAHVYKCLAPDAKRPPPQCQSNNLTVQSLSRPLCPVIQSHFADDTTLSLTWTHDTACFSDCIEYNVTWWHPLGYKIVSGTSYTINGLQPRHSYNVQVCAVCEGYPPSCTATQQYTTTVNVAASVLSILVIGLVVAIILCVSCCVKRYKKKSGEGAGYQNTGI